MAATVVGWQFEVERGPDWLFVRVHGLPEDEAVQAEFAEQISALLERHFVHRIVIEMEGVPRLSSALIGQFVRLQKQLSLAGGVMRICGLSARCEQALRISRLDGHLAIFDTREEAVLGSRPTQPR